MIWFFLIPPAVGWLIIGVLYLLGIPEWFLWISSVGCGAATGAAVFAGLISGVGPRF